MEDCNLIYRMSYYAFVLFRLANAFLVSTWFVPDEIFQSVEVAYERVFGVGYLSWEWHPSIALRSAIHPSIHGAAFWALKELGLDYNGVINWTPNILNAFLFAAGDVCYLAFLKRVFRFNKKAVMPAMALYLTNWFVLYCATRSLSNSIEAALTLIALKYYTFGKLHTDHPKCSSQTLRSRKTSSEDERKRHGSGGSTHSTLTNEISTLSLDDAVPFGSPYRNGYRPLQEKKLILFKPKNLDNSSHIAELVEELKNCYGDTNYYRWVIFWASLAVLIRPTAVLIWAPLCALQFFESPTKLAYIFKAALPCSILVVGFGVWIDYFHYGSLKLTLWNFVEFNVLEGGSAEFGRNVWYWYVENGLPSVLTFLCAPLVTRFLRMLFHQNAWDGESTRKNLRRSWSIPSRFLWTTVFYVVIHSLIAHKEHRFLLPIIPLLIPALFVEIEHYPRRLKRYFKATSIIVNVGLALYFGIVHQRGPNHAARIVLREVAASNNNMTVSHQPQFHILQLMPCFSMPQYIRFHNFNHRITIRMLDCTPLSAKMKMRKMEESIDGLVENDFSYDSFDELDSPRTDPFKRRLIPSYVDEDDQFDMDALGWLRSQWQRPEAGLHETDLIVAYERTYARVQKFLESHGFTISKNIFHANFLHSDSEDFRIVIAVRNNTSMIL